MMTMAAEQQKQEQAAKAVAHSPLERRIVLTRGFAAGGLC